jgi:hypothetical protein
MPSTVRNAVVVLATWAAGCGAAHERPTSATSPTTATLPPGAAPIAIPVAGEWKTWSAFDFEKHTGFSCYQCHVRLTDLSGP